MTMAVLYGERAARALRIHSAMCFFMSKSNIDIFVSNFFLRLSNSVADGMLGNNVDAHARRVFRHRIPHHFAGGAAVF